ncbi:hypothetical protein BH23PAT2_BH23PAT2_08440 [soil metagenome]
MRQITSFLTAWARLKSGVLFWNCYRMVDSMDIDKNVRLTKGYTLSLVLIGIPSVAWIFGFEFGDRDPIEISATIITKTVAFGGMAMFAWSLVLYTYAGHRQCSTPTNNRRKILALKASSFLRNSATKP